MQYNLFLLSSSFATNKKEYLDPRLHYWMNKVNIPCYFKCLTKKNILHNFSMSMKSLLLYSKPLLRVFLKGPKAAVVNLIVRGTIYPFYV